MGGDGIASKLADALVMFWQALDEQERKLIVVGCAYLIALAIWGPVERRRREAERSALADEVVQRLLAGEVPSRG